MSELEKLREKEKDKRKIKKIIFAVTLILMIGLYFFFTEIKPMISDLNEELNKSTILEGQLSECLEGKIPTNYCDKNNDNGIKEIITTFLNPERTLFINILIFLGVIYLIQLVFSIAFDIFQLFAILLALVLRIKRKIFKKKEKKE